jgi:hypothetical protein
MKETPQKEHQWLEKLVGEWTFEVESTMGPDQPPIKSEGTESVRSLGGYWILGEGQGGMPGGGSATTILTLGYDPQKKRYVGTWIGSMMSHMWVYDGTLSADGSMLTLDTEGPSMSGDGTLARYQDIIEFKSDDYRILAAQTLDGDGKWNRFMTAHYRRKKGT